MNLFNDDDLIFDDDNLNDEGENFLQERDAVYEEESFLTENLNQTCIGHEALEKSLLDLFHKKKIPQSIIFSGLQGIGKTTIAFQFVRFLLKHGNTVQESFFGIETEPQVFTSMYVDVQDPVFRMMAAGAYPDFLHIHRDTDSVTGKKNATLKVEALRKIEPFLHKTSLDGGWRIVLIEDADTMNNSAQNAILKILEEPPKNVLILLVAHRLGKIISTVRSRSRVFYFEPLSKENMLKLLEKKCAQYSYVDREIIYNMANGSVGRALRLIDEDGVPVFKRFLELSQDFPHWDWLKIYEFANEVSSPANDKVYRMFTEIVLWFFEEMMNLKARQIHSLPEYLSHSFVEKFVVSHSLQDIILIHEQLKRNFERCDYANLDRRDAVRASFLVISQ